MNVSNRTLSSVKDGLRSLSLVLRFGGVSVRAHDRYLGCLLKTIVSGRSLILNEIVIDVGNTIKFSGAILISRIGGDGFTAGSLCDDSKLSIRHCYCIICGRATGQGRPCNLRRRISFSSGVLIEFPLAVHKRELCALQLCAGGRRVIAGILVNGDLCGVHFFFNGNRFFSFAGFVPIFQERFVLFLTVDYSVFVHDGSISQSNGFPNGILIIHNRDRRGKGVSFRFVVNGYTRIARDCTLSLDRNTDILVKGQAVGHFIGDFINIARITSGARHSSGNRVSNDLADIRRNRIIDLSYAGLDCLDLNFHIGSGGRQRSNRTTAVLSLDGSVYRNHQVVAKNICSNSKIASITSTG